MPLHADDIGSLLRRHELLDARAAHERGELGGSTMATKVTTEVKLATRRAGGLRTNGRIAGKEVAFPARARAGPVQGDDDRALHVVRDWYRPGATDAYPDTGR